MHAQLNQRDAGGMALARQAAVLGAEARIRLHWECTREPLS